jgi:hypothetical protein
MNLGIYCKFRTDQKNTNLETVSFFRNQGQGCYDYLVVKNKRNTTRLCGNRNPGVMMSTTNEMHIEFVSDNSMSKKGFEAEYRTGTAITP